MNEDKLVFLISQPRSGSTLLQKLLVQNSQIYSQSEPWLMLHPAYSIKTSGVYAEYNKEVENKAFFGFIDNLPGGGRDTYIKHLKSMYLNLYGEYLKESGHSYFLDKTPRYYLVWKELTEIFPNAKYIVLRRNPLSVLYSIIMTWNNEKWFRLSEFKYDLKAAIDSSVAMINSEVGCNTKYEELVDNPDSELQKLSSYIGIPFEKNMLSYDNNEQWEYGDQDYISSRNNISSERKSLWEKSDLSQQTWRVLSDYLEWIGIDRLALFGYDYNMMRNTLDKSMPATSLASLTNNTFDLESLLDSTKNCLIENTELKSQILSQEKEAEFYKEIRCCLEKHFKSKILRQPIAKIRSYKNILDTYKSITSYHEK